MKIVGTIKKIFENPKRDGTGVWHNIILDDGERVSCWKKEFLTNIQEGDTVEIPVEQTESGGKKYINVCGQVTLYNAKLDEYNNPDDEDFDPKELEGLDEEDRELMIAQKELEQKRLLKEEKKEEHVGKELDKIRQAQQQDRQTDIRRAVALKAICSYAGKDDNPYTIEDIIEMCKRAMIFLDTGE